jgi:hypothetical protein
MPSGNRRAGISTTEASIFSNRHPQTVNRQLFFLRCFQEDVNNIEISEAYRN